MMQDFRDCMQSTGCFPYFIDKFQMFIWKLIESKYEKRIGWPASCNPATFLLFKDHFNSGMYLLAYYKFDIDITTK